MTRCRRSRPPGLGIRSRVGLLPLYPFAFGAAFLLNHYLAMGGYLSIVARPLLVLFAVVALLQLALWLVTRDRHIGAFLATAVLAMLLDPVLALVIVAVGGVLLIATGTTRNGARHLDWHRVTSAFNVVAFATLLANVVLIGQRASEAFPPALSARAAAPAGAPDIYVILLDEYPRTDTLAAVFGFDNRPFIDALTELGFEESAQSHSNYNATSPTLVSMFDARQVHQVLGGQQGDLVTSEDLQGT